MALATWWTTDALPDLPALHEFDVTVHLDDESLARLNGLSPAQVQERRSRGHRPYVATLGGVPATYGWVATKEASIGELNLAFALSDQDRYLWDFATLPQFQGRGLYPRLLRAILRRESKVASRFWIIHAPENLPSGAGMRKAGFKPAGYLSFRADGGVGLAPYEPIERARAAAALLGVPLIETVLAPCWCCNGVTEQPLSAADSLCWSPLQPQAAQCTCAVEVKPGART